MKQAVKNNKLTKRENKIENIENKFKIEGKKIAIGYGNWSIKSQMKNFFSTPNQGFRKLIHSKFLTITVHPFECI